MTTILHSIFWNIGQYFEVNKVKPPDQVSDLNFSSDELLLEAVSAPHSFLS